MKGELSLLAYLGGQPLFLLAVAGLVIAGLGWRLETSGSRLGDRLRTAGYLAMGLAAILMVIDTARKTEDSDAALELVDKTRAEVVGSETVIPLGGDGHYHAVAAINGIEIPVMIDTGASYTTLEEATAKQLGLVASTTRLPTELGTANGLIPARFARAREFRLGSIAVQGLDIAVTPDTTDPLAVVGMDILSSLASWRVEQGKLHLRPRN